MECRFIYRCRMCGQEFGNLVAGDRLADDMLASIIVLGKDVSHGIGLYPLDTHHCADGNVGIADLIGYRCKEAPGGNT